jgi:hypothetical protein
MHLFTNQLHTRYSLGDHPQVSPTLQTTDTK